MTSRFARVALLASCLTALSVSSSLSKELTTIQSLQPPPWPLQPLTTEEREARLKFVLDTQDYVTSEARQPLTKNDCNNILTKLKESKSVHILEPSAIAQSRDDGNVPDNLIQHCSTVEIDRAWFSSSNGPLSTGVDPNFDSLPLDEKDAAASFYHKKDGPMEFYDVSRFFNGRKTWATFAEGGRVVCNDDPSICSSLEGYRLRSDVVIGAVLDSQSCKTHIGSKVVGGTRIITGTSKPYSFRELPGFYAYADIGQKLFRLSLATTIPWGDFHRLLSAGGTTLAAQPIDSAGGLCLYESKPREKGE